ncbi:MAG: hypothetical protein ND866_23540, partial [Pyrinomonadaceae bacterium]|nr:hypothetical protein [Pyrinomonadaceae bacterium]
AAQRIAIRTMLKTEALDFDMDPRGIIPDRITQQNNFVVAKQIQFIIGHEYAHHIHGHLDRNAIVDQPLFLRLHNEAPEQKWERFYNHNEKQELEADESSLLQIKCEGIAWTQMVYSILAWFA